MAAIMTPERWAHVQRVFDEALAYSPTERDTYLDGACGDDTELRAEVASLIAADTQPTPAVLDAPADVLASAVRPADGGDGAHEATEPLAIGRVLGPYRLLRRIGRGGMGAVYLAERDDLGKQVALKLLPDGRATPGSVRRFLAERRVLARLEHPNIARLLDAGLTDDGTPYFAMEYVDGAPLVAACDARRMPVRERLALFTQVCDAVAYAHRNLVVHRDLKPSNVLVRTDGTVRLLDFGIAKLLSAAGGGDAPAAGGDAALAEGQTSGAWLMTPRYAAPEQRRGGPITTATDVYALGLLLHELVSGERPPVHLPSLATLGVALDGVPATTASGSATVAEVAWRPEGADDAPGVREARARARNTTLDGLRRALAGDLAAVVRHATHEDPALRYASAEGLGDDLRRHLARLPVRARPAERGYRAALFVRRNRWAVAGVAALFALLAGSAAVAAVQQAQTRQALAQATAEAAKAREVTQFVTSLFRDVDPYQLGGGDGRGEAAAEELLKRGATRLERDLTYQPAVRATVLRTLGVVGRNMGRFDDADALLRRGLATRRQLHDGRPGPDRETADFLHELGVVQRLRGDYAAADTLLAQALAIRAALPGGDSADVAATRFELGALRRHEGRVPEAEAQLRLALAARRAMPGPARAEVLEELASARGLSNDPDSGAVLIRQAITLRERWQGPQHPLVALGYTRLSVQLRNAGHVAAAEQAVRHALAVQDGRIPAGHPDRMRTESELSWVLIHKGDYAGAERLQRPLVAMRRALYGRGRDVAGSLYTLGYIRYRRGDAAEAVDMLRRAVREYATYLAPGSSELAAAERGFAVAAATAGREDEALAAAARLTRAEGTATWDEVAQPLAALAGFLRSEGDCGRAVPLYRRALLAYATRHAGAPPDAPHAAELRAGQAACGRPADAGRP